jgi:hypothetical protein
VLSLGSSCAKKTPGPSAGLKTSSKQLRKSERVYALGSLIGDRPTYLHQSPLLLAALDHLSGGKLKAALQRAEPL